MMVMLLLRMLVTTMLTTATRLLWSLWLIWRPALLRARREDGGAPTSFLPAIYPSLEAPTNQNSESSPC